MSTVQSRDRTLPRILADNAVSGTSGVLQATRGKLKRVFCLEKGWLVFGASNLIEEQLEEYELLLEEQAFPFEEKAIAIHLANFRRIPAGTYDEPTRKSLQVLGELMPFRYARAGSSDAHVEVQ